MTRAMPSRDQLSEWMRKLRLTDWLIRLSEVAADDDDRSTVDIDANTRQAVIRFDPVMPADQAERQLVHELLHVRMIQIEDAFLRKIGGIVEQHLSEPEFEIDQLARLAGMSRSQLFRKIKALTGKSPSLFIRAIRLHHAGELLQMTDMNVSEVAYEVGFSTPAYFSDAFTEAYGVRPSQVRK